MNNQPFWEWCFDRAGRVIIYWLWLSRHWLIWLGFSIGVEFGLYYWNWPASFLWLSFVTVTSIISGVHTGKTPPYVFYRWLCNGHTSLRDRWKAETNEQE